MPHSESTIVSTRMLIDNIVVGERRRTDLGDITGLAASVSRYGLLHPIVVDIQGELVAGERRLKACQQLGWSEIDVRYLGQLSDAERREIELEENLRRKDLTEYERARTIKHLATNAAEILEQQSDGFLDAVSKNPRGGRPEKPAAREKVADRIGIGRHAIERAEVHVETAEAYPFMQAWKQYQVLEAKEALEDLAPPERESLASILSQPGIPPKDAITTIRNVVQMEVSERARIFNLADSDDSRDRTTALTEAARAPAMPDPRLALLDDAKRIIRKAARMFPGDSANDAITAILPPFDAAYAAIGGI